MKKNQKREIRTRWGVVGLWFLLCVLNVPAADRVALVIGNGAYTGARSLPNPTRDATAVAALLESRGFEVIHIADAGVAAMYEGLERFKTTAAGAEIGLFYYAGHGMEVDGRNYLLPVDAELESPAQLRTQAVSVDTVLSDMNVAKIPAKLVILDCCRDNPLSRSWLMTRTSQQGGLSPIEDKAVPPATMIMFASAPGEVALDGTGENSPFTSALLEQLGKPGQSAFDAFLGVSDAVAKTTKERQVPWIKFDGAGRTFRLFSLGNAAVGPPGPVVVAVLPTMPVLPPEKPEPVPADISRGFTNSLGMKMVPVPGTEVLFCEHETRVQDFRAFVEATGYRGGDDPVESVEEWLNVEYEGHKQGPDHPVVNVSWDDAKAFCAWLSKKEGREYRLPTDHEWSVAVGIGDRESETASPKDKNQKIDEYPWGTAWPPPSGAGNLSGSESASRYQLDGYEDRHAFTAPVGEYGKSRSGLYDLSGNVWERCEDWFHPTEKGYRVSRGGSFYDYFEGDLSSSRRRGSSSNRTGTIGFRVVVSVGD